MPHHHIKPAQFELFALSDKANAVTTPEWQDLGCESRMALIAAASFIEFRQRWR